MVGHSQGEVGSSDAASAGIVTRRAVEDRPVLRPAEVLELVPGVIVTQHSRSGKANQFFLRGFNLDHGTDVATTLDGVPLNLRTHAHGQGYTDLNFLLPELVEPVAYSKGPYDASKGDFASAGRPTSTSWICCPGWPRSKEVASATCGPCWPGRQGWAAPCCTRSSARTTTARGRAPTTTGV